MTHQFIKLDPFKEYFDVNAWAGNHTETIEESYNRWNHLKEKLKTGVSVYELEDFIVGAKRLINYRTKELFSLYGLKESLQQIARKGDFYLLEELDIARPYLLNKLREMRNNVEHEFNLSVDLETCQDYLDICWYYLRSTDYFFIRPASRLVNLSSSWDTPNSEVFKIQFDYNTKSLSFHAKIHKDDFVDASDPNSAEIDVKSQEVSNVHKDILEVHATIIGPEAITLTIFRNFFRII
jgi:hypothetical protein